MDGFIVKLVETESELDEVDATATHAIALSQGQVGGTGRLQRREGATAQIGRMAVDVAWRRKGIGGWNLEFLEETARTEGMRHSVLHAQEYAMSFYAAHGYREQGDTFLEVDIPHIEMHEDL